MSKRYIFLTSKLLVYLLKVTLVKIMWACQWKCHSFGSECGIQNVTLFWSKSFHLVAIFATNSFPMIGLSTPYSVSIKGRCPSEPGFCLWFQIMALLTKGNKQRTQESTAANKTSSRSHAILQASLKQRHTHTITMCMTSNWHCSLSVHLLLCLLHRWQSSKRVA